MKMIVFQIQRLQGRLKYQSIITIVVLALLITVVLIAIPSVSGMATMSCHHTSSGAFNMTFVGNMMGGRSMMMPGGNMTFGASLHNAKMHLTEAIMDLKSGNTNGTMTEINLTDQAIKAHEQEIKSMMMEMKGIMAHFFFHSV